MGPQGRVPLRRTRKKEHRGRRHAGDPERIRACHWVVGWLQVAAVGVPKRLQRPTCNSQQNLLLTALFTNIKNIRELRRNGFIFE